MKTRILFFDDEPKTAQNLAEALTRQGYTVCLPKDLTEAFHEINVNGAEALIHSAHKTKTNGDLCEGIFSQYPHFPSIHLATGEASESYQSMLSGPFHVKLRPLTPIKDFMKRVRRLVFLGRLARQNATLTKALKLRSRIDRIFETLELGELKAKCVEFCSDEFKAKNVYFLSVGGFGYYLQEMWKVAPMPSQTDSTPKHVFCSASESSEAELSQYLAAIADQVPTGWELRHGKTLVSSQGKNKNSICFIPLIGSASKKVLGHIMLVDPLLYGEKALEKVLPYLTRVLGRHMEHALNFSNAKSLNYMDDLTELYNQRYLKLVLDKEINRAARTKKCFSVLFMDIDHFKHVNDSKGHVVGSKVLIELSKILLEQMRVTDYGFRYGGDEFILILVDSDSSQSLSVAERVRKQVEAAIFDVNGQKIKVTLSIGIATYPDHATTKEQILELADRAMYCGKNKSRNVVYVAS